LLLKVEEPRSEDGARGAGDEAEATARAGRLGGADGVGALLHERRDGDDQRRSAAGLRK